METQATYPVFHISDLHFSLSPLRLHWRSVPDLIAYHRYIKECLPSGEDFSMSCELTSHSEAIKRRLAHRINEDSAKGQTTVISGDISAAGKKEELEIGKSFIEDKRQRESITKLYKDLTYDVSIFSQEQQLFLVPGNHDRYKNEKGEPGGSIFYDVFSSYWPKSEYVSEPLVLGEKVENKLKLAFIGVDFCLHSKSQINGCLKWGRYGQGFAGSFSDKETPLYELIKKTKNFIDDNPDTPIVWVTHFPIRHSDENRCLQLVNADLVENAAIELGVQVILSGHRHDFYKYKHENHQLTIINAGSATSIGTAFSFTKIMFVVENGIVYTQDSEWRYNKNMDEFQLYLKEPI
ncbi:MAG: metallophosphoesterase [Candidatus Thiodiazotropha sp.]